MTHKEFIGHINRIEMRARTQDSYLGSLEMGKHLAALDRDAFIHAAAQGWAARLLLSVCDVFAAAETCAARQVIGPMILTLTSEALRARPPARPSALFGT